MIHTFVAFSEGTYDVRDFMQISFFATKRKPPWSQNSLIFSTLSLNI